MPSRIEAEARRLIQRLYHDTGDRMLEWRAIGSLGVDGASPALQHAIDEGWLLIEGGHSVCLTDKGRRSAS